MRSVLLCLAVAMSCTAGCGPGKTPNDPPPTPQDSGADRATYPKPIAPKKE